MKAFALAVLFVIVAAVGGYFVLEQGFRQRADEAFATQSVRVGEGGSIENRNFSGR